MATGVAVPRFVVVEGLIGSGKTTLARLLERERGAELVLEPHEDNPFLASFYRDPDRYALPVQLYFLLTRYRQMDRLRQPSLFHPLLVSDYLFEKDRVFAEKTLPSHELELYDRFAGPLGAESPQPDLVVWVRAPVPVLLKRIRKRGVAGEDRITAAYLEDLAERYEVLFGRWSRSPVLYLDSVAFDYQGDAAAQAEVLRQIDEALAAGGAPRATNGRQGGLFD
jgi:deoxyadenosine/deoxycytidine kinase